jgi:uncharacterized oxidoreductase
MVLQNNTILITGGSSGIGLELTKKLSKNNNKILICGRSLDKLKQAKKGLPSVHYFQCDLSKADECMKLTDWVKDEHPDCNILINNAAIVHAENFYQDENILPKAHAELQTNLMAPIRLSKLLTPLLEKNELPKIINITTGLIYAPRVIYPFYNASKAALHSFTQVLRAQYIESPINVLEVQFPAVDTPWHNGNPPDFAISPTQAVMEMISGIEKGHKEIKVGKVRLLYWLSRVAPQFVFRKLNRMAN